MDEKFDQERLSDTKDSTGFTLLSDPKKVKSKKRTASHFLDIQPRASSSYSLSDVVTPKKLSLFQMDLFSPAKEEDGPVMVSTPRHKRRASDSHTGLTPGLSELLPSNPKKSRKSCEYDNKEIKKSSVTTGPISSLAELNDEGDIEMNAGQVFSSSPGSPSSKFRSMLAEIDVSPNIEHHDDDDFLKRQTSYNIRRCKSLELRKKLIDMTNTPPCGFKKSLFKKPALPNSEAKSPEPKDGKPMCQKTLVSPQKPKNDITFDSADQQRIKEAVDVLQSQDLIADGSRCYCLPVVKGKHSDLQNIDHNTMGMLLSDKYPNPEAFDKLTVIDCRYPYEYHGGHIQGAINIYTEEAMAEFLDDEIKKDISDSQMHILVFHCEFSSQRGPSLLRHLRNCDRQLNMHRYPQLVFPEVYCLFGGYKEFYSNHADLCEPSAYVPMIDEKYASDLRHFRAKAKSWAAGDRLKLKQQNYL